MAKVFVGVNVNAFAVFRIGTGCLTRAAPERQVVSVLASVRT